MARYEFKLPDIGEGIAEAEIVAWHVKVGDTIGEDQQIADMMTDKATVEMESPVAGKVIELAGEVGDQMPIGSVLAVIETEGADRAAEPVDGQRGRASARRRRGRGDARAGARNSGHEGRGRPPREGESPQPRRRRARSRQKSPTPVRERPWSPRPRLPRRPRPRARPRHRPCTGEDGVATASATPTSTPISSTTAAPSRRAAPAAPRKDETIKVVGLRRKIAENMQEAKRRIPHFTLVEEFDVTALEETRAMMNKDRGSNPKLTLLPFLITAMATALARMADAQRDLRRRCQRHHPPRRAQPRHGDPDPERPDGRGHPRRSGARACGSSRREIVRLADAARSGKATREELTRLDHHLVEPRADGRHHLDPGHQPPRGRDHRRQQGRGEARRRSTARSRSASA